ncbi:MAG: transposase [Thermoplasmataceae archaeon]
MYKYKKCPERDHRMGKTTNVIERLNLEPNRIAKEIGAFPDDESITGRRSMNMEAIWSCVGSFRNYSDSCTLSQRLPGNSVKNTLS